MTNRPKNPAQAAVVRAVAEATAGKGLPANGDTRTPGGILLPEPQMVPAKANLVFRIVDAMGGQVLVGREVALTVSKRTGETLSSAAVPNMTAMLELMRAEWPEPDAVQAAKLALAELVAEFQRKVYELGPAVRVAQEAAKASAPPEAPAVVPADDVLPEAPTEDRAPVGLHALEDEQPTPAELAQTEASEAQAEAEGAAMADEAAGVGLRLVE